MKLYKYLTAIGALALSAGFTACDDDDTVYDYPGVDGQVVIAPTVTGDFNIVKTPASYVAPSLDSWQAKIRTRIAATEQIDVKFETYNAGVAEYNAANGTEYEVLPEGFITLQVPELVVDETTTLPASQGASVVLSVYPGDNVSKQVVSASITSDQTALASLDLSKQYMVAVKMTEVVKGQANIGVSATNISYITLGVTELLINETPGATPSGSLLSVADRTDWVGTPGDGAYEWDGWESAWNGSGSGNWGSYPAGSTLIVDMQTPRTFDGIRAYPYYGSSGYALFTADSEILISNDGSDWTSLGVLNSWKSDVVLYAPMSARYIKVIRGQGDYCCTTDFNIYAL